MHMILKFFFLDRQRTEERKQAEDMRELERKRKHMVAFKVCHLADRYFILIIFLSDRTYDHFRNKKN